MTEGRTPSYRTPLVTATHALHLLTLFSDEHPELGVTQMSERLGLAKSIVSRIVSTYVAEGVLVQDEITRRYRLGPLLLELGLIAGELHPVRRAAEEPLKALRDETGQNTLLWLRVGDEEALCLASYRGAHAIAPPIPAGTRIKLSDTVAGQAMAPGGGARVGEGAEAAGTGASTEDGTEGGLIGAEPCDRSIHTAACAIADSSGRVVAVIAVSATEAWFRTQPAGSVEAATARAAREISARLD